MARQIEAGTTDVSVIIRIVDAVDGTPETGVVASTSGLALQYRRELAVSVNITPLVALAALTTVHTDRGFLHIGNGYYRLDLADAACASGTTGVLIHGTCTGMVVIGEYIELTTIATLAEMKTELLTTALTEAYAADNVAPTQTQLLFMIWSALSQFAIAGTTITCKQLNGSTTSMTFTLDSSTNPTSRTRTT